VSGSRPRILVIDDEPQIHRFLGPALDAAGYEPVRADTAEAGRRELARRAPDAVVLDLGLPDLDGKEVLGKARAFYSGPILILSARDRETEKIDALDLGADDYVEKPFGVGELLARLRVALRHAATREGAKPVVVAGDLTIDLGQGAGKVVTHRQLLTAVWGPAHETDVQYLRVFIGQLRQKIEPDTVTPSLILTEPGVGYRWMGE